MELTCILLEKCDFLNQNRAILSDFGGPFWLNIMVYWVTDMNGKCSILQKRTPGKYHIFAKKNWKLQYLSFFVKFVFNHKIIWIFGKLPTKTELLWSQKMNKIAEKTTKFLYFEEKNVREFHLFFVLIFGKKGEFFQYLAVTVFILTPKNIKIWCFWALVSPTS